MATSTAPTMQAVSNAKAAPQAKSGSASMGKMPRAAIPSEQQLMDNWLNIQSINLTRHAKSLRPFTKDEFGTGTASPSEAHIEAVNRFIDKFRSQLVERARWVDLTPKK